MFPTAGSIIHRNEAGEVLGWDDPADYEPEYCDQCGFTHTGDCYDPYYNKNDDEEDEEPDTDCHCGHDDCGAC